MPRVTLVIPCYNEAPRLPAARFAEFAARDGDIAFLFVDDGSTDSTPDVIRGLVDRDPGLFTLLSLDHNRGKGEAVRAGMLKATGEDAEYVGYWDADLSTPLEEIPRFIDRYRQMPDKIMLAGARVKMMGRVIERHAARHYMGRVFATAASWMLDIEMYDTQCGAKLFRRTPLVHSLFESPFQSRWLFDLELLLRMRRHTADTGGPTLDAMVYEIPLNAWRDIPGSKVNGWYFFRALVELGVLRKRYPPRAANRP